MPKKNEPLARDIIVVSDLHCGGSTALMPPEFETIERQIVKANPLQLWYWEVWQTLWSEWVPYITEGRPFVLVVNGDAVEGNHHRTKEIVSPEVMDHIDIAYECLEKPSKAAIATVIVDGTECHTGNGEHGLARRLKALGPDGKSGAWARFDVTVDGYRSIFQHHISTSGRPWLEAHGLLAQLATERLEAVAADEPPPFVLSSAHRHRPGLWQSSSGISGVTGAWQALTRHGRKVVPSARCWPSALHFHYPAGEKPRAREFLRKPPRLPSITL